MPTCPNGHPSAADDYCDVCGGLMTGAAPTPPPAARTTGGHPPAAGGAAGASTGAGQPPGSPDEPCPVDDTPRTGRFCETCGYDFETGNRPGGPLVTSPTLQMPVGAPAASTPSRRQPAGQPVPRPVAGPGGWSAVVAADRAYFETVLAELGPDAGSLSFPPYAPERRYMLVGPQVRIGRRSASRGFTPEIDLSAPPEDPGVSHVHAVLLARPDGTWVLVDPGSTNGTTLNGSADPIEFNVEVPVHDGDRIHVGAWTTITLRKD
ncbi:FHA domain-containing protein [Thermomonospora echinospora]|uniref:FHA domain-containing protein n=1 Tax=Thermomonospora echinospora TaxID=1992 RepID=A0A1H6DYH2_9ACTN|nr:FHA domain-containing protein [Thermomonospora echinospora]SEG89806.1 FHA domain-containing protein [Thermomonospora echinospora]